MENRPNMHSQKRREISEDSSQFSISGVPRQILSAGESGTSANTNEGSVDGETPVVEQPDVAAETQACEEAIDLAPNEELGRYLRLEREAKQISIGDIAKTTKIPKTSLEALEEGRFGDLPGDVFVRGFLRSYARCLKVDGDEVIRRYVQCGLCPAPVSSDMADSLLKPNQRRARSFTSAPGQNSDADTQTSSQLSSQVSSQVASRGAKSVVAKETTARSSDESASRKSVKKVLKDAFDLARTSSPTESKSTDLKGTDSKSKVATKSKTGHKIEVVDMSSETSAIKLVEAPAEEKRVRIFVPPVLDFGEDRTARGPLTLGVIILVIVATLTMSYLLRRPGVSTEGFTQLDNSTPVQELLASGDELISSDLVSNQG